MCIKIGRRRFAIGFVVRIDGAATADIGLAFVPSDGDVFGLEFFDNLNQHTGKTVDTAGRCAVGQREMPHGVVSSVEYAFSVNDCQIVFKCHSSIIQNSR